MRNIVRVKIVKKITIFFFINITSLLLGIKTFQSFRGKIEKAIDIK